jgi:hypothetical protein
MQLDCTWHIGSDIACDVVMVSAAIDVCIRSFLFAPKSPHINKRVSNADDVHPPSHKQLLNVNKPSISTMKAHSIQINCPSAGVGLSSSSVMSFTFRLFETTY